MTLYRVIHEENVCILGGHGIVRCDKRITLLRRLESLSQSGDFWKTKAHYRAGKPPTTLASTLTVKLIQFFFFNFVFTIPECLLNSIKACLTEID